MANNGGRQGGGGGNGQMNEHVEFTVKVSYADRDEEWEVSQASNPLTGRRCCKKAIDTSPLTG
jgi:hypothetical protein